ncbi:MAG TPA: pyrroloquinoline quinone biosynthesis protein PqqB [Dictyobacter sp.]|jgi:pyrroloquinoline quinone biosynthesis protein B|nr:pyrroloquinoline quinone biosynthesis protein PqqB [Dictyobacter sp.]
MRVRLLGTAAGGGFPQWNCNCTNCQGVRSHSIQAQARTQSCIALSVDQRRWLLLNASPDIRAQIASFPPLSPPAHTTRGTGIEAILLTDADLDHTLGLLLLREGARHTIYATASVQSALTSGLTLAPTLACYSRVTWHEPASALTALCYADGTPSGLSYAAFPLAGKPPRYREQVVTPQIDDRVGYRFVDEHTGGRLVFLPGVAAFNETVMAQLRDCDALLLDGTFWSEHEMQEQCVGATTATQMGHLPIGGPDGSLRHITELPIRQKVYTHINNTNPILQENSPEHAAVLAAGVAIGWDGLELTL